jgi:putative ABC transport system permease protein
MRLLALWRNLLRRGRIERDLDAELRAAFDLLVDEKTNAGMSLASARRAVALEFGGIEAVKDRVRDRRAGAWIDAFIWDVRYAARLLCRNPLFAATAALSLAIGIGATTTIFTIANGLLLRSAPGVRDSDRLVDVVRTRPGHFGINPVSYLDYLDIRQRTTTLDGVYAYRLEPMPMTFGDRGEAESVFANLVTWMAVRAPARYRIAS